MNGLEDEYAGQVNVARLDAAESQNAALQSQYGLRGHPSFAILDEEGTVVESFLGPQDEETLRAAVAGVAEP